MSVISPETQVTTLTAAFPRVNLLPPEIAETQRLRRVQAGLGLAALASVAAVALLYLQAGSAVSAAQQQLSAAQAQQTSLQTQLARYNDVQQVAAQVQAAKAMYATAMGPAIDWAGYLNDLTLSIPDNVWLTSVSATESATAPGAPAPSTGLVPSGIGTINFAGVAFSRYDVANWLDSLAKEPGYTFPYVSNVSETTIGPRVVVNFSSSVVLTPQAETGVAISPVGN